jgi:hypothetical protein
MPTLKKLKGLFVISDFALGDLDERSYLQVDWSYSFSFQGAYGCSDTVRGWSIKKSTTHTGRGHA